jgi:histidine ammonia-lyase
MNDAPFVLNPGRLGLADLRALARSRRRIALDPAADAVIDRSAQVVQSILDRHEVAYGINTGFGSLAHTRIPDDQVAELQRRLVLSHAAGIGPALSDEIVRIILILKINALARGFSGIRRSVIDALLKLLNAEVYPIIPSKGSVGASGDLAPLAHLSAVLLGIGAVRHEGRTLSAVEGLTIAGLQPVTLVAKEGLALLNGTQV